MKKSLFLIAAMLFSGEVFAATDHYVLRDGNLVQHLKITKIKDEINLSADVNFDPEAGEAGNQPCSGEVSGEAKSVGANELVIKKHAQGEASFCELKIHLTPNGAKVEQSNDCVNFAPGMCRFSTDGKELVKIKQ
jgi:hypothetical protein